MKRTYPVVTLAALLLASAGLMAGPQSDVAAPSAAGVLVETDAKAIVDQQTGIRREATERRGRYRDLEGADRDRLVLAQDRVLRALEGRTSTTELSPTDQRTLFNDLEEISAIVNKAEDERMICERSRPIGSNRPVSVCKTVAQRRAEREQLLESRGGRDGRCSGGACPDSGLDGWR